MFKIAIAVALCIHAAVAFMPTSSRFASSAMKMVVMPPPPKDTKSGKNILDTAKSTGVHNTLVAALTAAGLDSIFTGSKKLVLFAPTDEAFGKLPPGTVDALLKDIPKLTEILKFHVSENMQRPSRNGRAYATYALHPDGEPKEIGVRVTVDTADSFMMGVNKGKVLGTVEATNGFVFPLDEVILPYEGKKPPYMNIKEEILPSMKQNT